MTEPVDYDVVIVGGGPVGLTAASLLGISGRRVALVERYDDVYPLPRAVRLDGEVMRTFQAIEIIDRISDELRPLQGYRWFGADDEEILYIKWDVTAPSGWANNYSFWQPAVDGALDERARSLPTVDVLRGWAAEGLQQSENQCSVQIRRATGGTDDLDSAEGDPQTLTAAFVIGADGANSVVRKASGIGQTDLGFEEHWLVVDVRPEDLSEWSVGLGEQHCNPDRPTVLVPCGNHHRRWEFMLLPGESPVEFADAERVWDLLEGHLARDRGELVRSAVYQFRSIVAEKMNQGRVFLAGDAAHLMPPFMGEGMCSGIRDAANLAWRLDLVVRGIADQTLLADYEIERKPHNEAMINLSTQMGRVSCTVDHEAAAARDRAFRAGEVPPPPPMPRLLEGTLLQDDPVGGVLVPQGRMRTPDGRVGKMDDLIGPGFSLICAGGDPRQSLDESLLSFLDSISAALVTFDRSAPSRFVDEDGQTTEFMETHGIVGFLARPDGYGFGSIRSETSLGDLVERLRDALGARSLAT